MSEPKIIEADEIRVGPIRITKTPDGGGGIWIGDAPLIALFSVPGQTGVGVYPNQNGGPCTCITVDQDGKGMIQFNGPNGEVAYLTFDQVKAMEK